MIVYNKLLDEGGCIGIVKNIAIPPHPTSLMKKIISWRRSIQCNSIKMEKNVITYQN
jgi:hypothetical protein